jgi:phospholipid/cholesterol/gamma-HCH transport system substrate-binding protein
VIRRVALLVVMTVLLSSCAVLGFKQACGGTELIGMFEQVGDLVENSNVQSSDVVIGSVTDIELDGWNARVTMCLQPDEQIPQNVKAVVRTTSLLGEKFVDLRPEAQGPPFLEDGDIIDVDQTSKATELEDVFARLAGVLGAGNLEQINRFTSAQAKILGEHAGELREVLRRLRKFTDVLADRRGQIATGVDNLDSVAKTILSDSGVLKDFLRSFADSSGVLADQKEGLQSLLFSLDRFSRISFQLLNQTEAGLNEQFSKLRPVLRTAVENSENLRQVLQTLATFAEWFPETMPGDYVQLDVCQAAPNNFEQGTTCPQSIKNDDPKATGSSGTTNSDAFTPENSLQFILQQSVRGAER